MYLKFNFQMAAIFVRAQIVNSAADPNNSPPAW